MTRLGLFLAGSFLAGCLFTAFLVSPFSCGNNGAGGGILLPPTARALPDWMTEDEKNSIMVFEKAAPSVVYIVNKAYVRSFFSLDVLEVPRGTGSGFIWDRKGYIVTNFHVLYEGNAFTVTLADQTQYDAQVVGLAPEKDLAVLKIDAPASKLRPIELGISRDLRPGQKVLAIGNPFGLDQTLTTGTVSALGREIKSLNGRTIHDVIQTDAAINPGNSGGPLLDSRGRLIGVNTAIYSPSGAYAGIGFAVPVDTVKKVVPSLIRYGKYMRPSLGARTFRDEVAERLGIEGVIIAEAPPGSAAAEAGLRGSRYDRYGRLVLGDIIVEVDGKPVRSYDDLVTILEQHQVGDRVRITYLRNGEKHTTTAVLQARPD